jgi:Flp pilus assembly protein TadG
LISRDRLNWRLHYLEDAVRKSPLPRLDRFAARFAGADKGSVAVEFGLVLLPFLTMVCALVELAMALLAYTSLEAATQAASRQIRTGEFQQAAAHGKTDFKALVCANMGWLSSQCASDAYVHVETFPTFADLAGNSPQSAGTFNGATTCFSPGNPTDIELVRVYFKWRLFTPFLDTAMENMGTNSGMRLMSTATAFRNEPYSDSAAVGVAKCT